MANKTIFRLEWNLSDILENYPELTLKQAQKVLDRLYSGRDGLIQEGWYVIADIVHTLEK